METAGLGRRVAEHRTDNNRRRRVATLLLVLALVGLGAGVPTTVAYFAGSWGPVAHDPRLWTGAGAAPAGLVGIGALCAVFGTVLAVRAVRTRGERFEVYERGFVHRTDTAVPYCRAISWADVVVVRQYGTVRTGLVHALGLDFGCVLRFTDGSGIRFGSYTADAPILAAQIDAAVNRGIPPH